MLDGENSPQIKVLGIGDGGSNAVNGKRKEGEAEPNIQRGELEFGFIFSYVGGYCEGDYSLEGKVQRVGEMIIASLQVP